jgi:hypothetical protein
VAEDVSEEEEPLKLSCQLEEKTKMASFNLDDTIDTIIFSNC